MRVKDVLQTLELGNSVAEFDKDLELYFVETSTFRRFISDGGDIVAGDKGTGKTALYRVFQKRYASLPELEKVEVVTAFNPTGNPVFQRLAQSPPLTEGQYITIWKTYILSLVGNWLLELYEAAPTVSMRELDQLLQRIHLRSQDDSAQTIFSKLVNVFSRLMKPKSAEVAISLSDAGIPVITPKIEFGGDAHEADKMVVIPHEEAFAILNRALEEADFSTWVLFDRLDEAFQGFPQTEVPALRALLRTYLDLLAYPKIRLKLFVRNDLFRKIIQGGFVNLTHVYARRIEIIWDEEDLQNLFCRRVRECASFVRELGLAGKSDKGIFDAIFPPQVDAGPRKPTTWAWIMSRIRDGNHVKPPRNLIDLIIKSQQAQLRSEDRNAREFKPGQVIVEADAIRRALRALSEQRVEDTLLAEAAEYAEPINRFRDGKAEHNLASIGKLLGVEEAEARLLAKSLVELGFLEEIGETFKVPMLYRDGLQITQGKAFQSEANADDEENGA
jgi:hypothetical protein